MNRHINWRIKRVKKLPNRDLGDYLDGRIRVKICNDIKEEMPVLVHEAVHATFDYYGNHSARLLISPEREEQIALYIEEQFKQALEELL